LTNLGLPAEGEVMALEEAGEPGAGSLESLSGELRGRVFSVSSSLGNNVEHLPCERGISDSEGTTTEVLVPFKKPGLLIRELSFLDGAYATAQAVRDLFDIQKVVVFTSPLANEGIVNRKVSSSLSAASVNSIPDSGHHLIARILLALLAVGNCGHAERITNATKFYSVRL